jgi:hypothetical protein
MAISRANQLKELLPGLNALAGLEYKSYDNEHEQLFETDSSERSFEEEQMLYGFGTAPVKTEGGVVQFDESGESYTARYNHETIALAFSFTEEAFEDNLYADIGKRNVKAMMRSMANTKQVKAAAIFNNGFSSYQTGDGVTLFNTAHPMVQGTLANRPTVAADLNETSLEQAIIDVGGYVDERQILINAAIRRLVVPRALQFTADRLLQTQLRTGTADNDINAIRNMGAISGGYAVNNYFTDPDAWVCVTDVPNGGKYFERVAMETSMDGDFNTGNTRYRARERYSFGLTDFRGYYGSPGSA